MHRGPVLAAAVAALLALSLLPAVAGAAQSPVISDCTANNKLTGHYSVTQLRTALSTLPADVKEYSACYDVIDRQLLTQLGVLHGSGGDGGGGGSFLPTPVIVVIVLLLLGGATYAGLALRRRSAGLPAEGEPPGEDPPAL